jgi:hypothetical protein
MSHRNGSAAILDAVSTIFEHADFSVGRTITFVDGSERVVAAIGPTWVGRGVYQPGWRWSAHARPITGAASQAHAGYVVSGAMVVQSSDGTEVVVSAGEAWFSGPDHDAWVAGDEPCVALDFPIAYPATLV